MTRAIHCRYHRHRLARGHRGRRLCRACYLRWYRTSRRDLNKDQKLRATYGITLVLFNKLWKRQKHACKICKLPMPKPHVDHDHETQKIRGLLCSHCNLGLGHFKDNVQSLKSAVKYLKENRR